MRKASSVAATFAVAILHPLLLADYATGLGTETLAAWQLIWDNMGGSGWNYACYFNSRRTDPCGCSTSGRSVVCSSDEITAINFASNDMDGEVQVAALETLIQAGLTTIDFSSADGTDANTITVPSGATCLDIPSCLNVGVTCNFDGVSPALAVCTPSPTTSPTVSPTVSPSVSPTVSPTVNPTVSPTVRPTVSPTVSPTLSPATSPTEFNATANATTTNSPTTAPTPLATNATTEAPTNSTTAPTNVTTEAPTNSTSAPVNVTEAPTNATATTEAPTNVTTVTEAPTNATTVTEAPTNVTTVTEAPTNATTVTEAPTNATTVTEAPTNATTVTEAPTNATTVTEAPTNATTVTEAPTNATTVTEAPTNATTDAPTDATTDAPTNSTEASTTVAPTNSTATEAPTSTVTDSPTSVTVTDAPTAAVTASPTATVTLSPTNGATGAPTIATATQVPTMPPTFETTAAAWSAFLETTSGLDFGTSCTDVNDPCTCPETDVTCDTAGAVTALFLGANPMSGEMNVGAFNTMLANGLTTLDFSTDGSVTHSLSYPEGEDCLNMPMCHSEGITCNFEGTGLELCEATLAPTMLQIENPEDVVALLFGLPIWIIAVVGAVLLLVILVVVYFCCCRTTKKSSQPMTHVVPK